MALFDMPLEQLRDYLPERDEPDDFDAFWQRNTGANASAPTRCAREAVDTGCAASEAFDVTFRGFGRTAGQGVAAAAAPALRTALPWWSSSSATAAAAALPHELARCGAAGYAHLVMDTRGQGAAGAPAATRPTRTASGARSRPAS